MKMQHALIQSDKETIARLKRAAGDKPVAAYVRELAAGSAGHVEERLDTICTIFSHIEERLDTICAVLMSVEQSLKRLSIDVMECPDIAKARMTRSGVEISDGPDNESKIKPGISMADALAELRRVFGPDYSPKRSRGRKAGDES